MTAECNIFKNKSKITKITVINNCSNYQLIFLLVIKKLKIITVILKLESDCRIIKSKNKSKM